MKPSSVLACRIGLCSGLIAALALASGAAPAELPKVEVEVRMKSGMFQEGFAQTGQDLAQTARDSARDLAAALKTALPYLDWVPAGSLGVRPTFGLVLSLSDRPTACDRQTRLALAARTPQGESPLAALWDQEVALECRTGLRTGDPAWLRGRLLELLTAQLQADPALQDLASKLGQKVPIAAELPVHDHAITVPFRPETLGADLASRLQAQFKVAGEGGEVEEGVIEMKLARPASWGTVCRVESFSFPGFSIPSLEIPISIEEHTRFDQILDQIGRASCRERVLRLV